MDRLYRRLRCHAVKYSTNPPVKFFFFSFSFFLPHVHIAGQRVRSFGYMFTIIRAYQVGTHMGSHDRVVVRKYHARLIGKADIAITRMILYNINEFMYVHAYAINVP